MAQYNTGAEKEIALSRVDEILARMREASGAKNNKILSEFMGLHPQATTDARKNGAIPPIWLVKLSRLFSVSMDWLLYGETVSGTQLREDQVPYGHDMELPELIGLATKILTSGNRQAVDALAKNIRYFAHAIEVEQRLAGVETRLGALEKLIKGKAKSEEDPEESSAGEAI